MIRIVAENLFFFLLPTIIYVAYVYMTREEKPEPKRVLNDAPLLWLFLAGVVLVVIVLVSFGKMEGGKPGQVYKPPVYKDGKVIPGHFE